VSESSEAATPPVAETEPAGAELADPCVAPAEDVASAAVAADELVAADGAGTEFSQLLETRPTDPSALAAGQRVRGKIISIGDDQIIVSLSGRPDAILATRELRGPDGSMLLRVNDPLSAFVETVGVPLVLSLGKRRGLLNLAKLRTAYEEKKSVTGIVRGANKGGFEVRVQGARGFCPLSQIDFGMLQDPQSYLGQTFTFRVLRWENGGRTIILSRRAILKEESETKAVETRQHLTVGAEFDGVVRRVQPFGAFVDIGGVEGLLHVSRIGRGHFTDATQVVTPGQPVKVRVTRIDESAGSGKERIALTAPDFGPDPWEAAGETLHAGEVVRGRVMRLAEFGAFVNVAPGIDGLVHVSELQPPPEGDGAPPQPPQPGDEIEVRIVRVDLEKKRVSLSMRLEPPPPRPQREAREPREARDGRDPRDPRRPRRDRPRDRDRGGDRDRDGSAFGSGGSLTHTMAEQLGALKRKLQVRP
jgi:small subunit ribosomal protein S1